MSAGFRAGQTNDGYFQINGTDILSVSSGVLGVKNTGAQSEVRLYCESNNAHYASLKSPPHSDFIGNVTFTLPGTAGNNGQVLQTDGSGNLSWVNNSGGGGGGGGGASDKLSEGNTEAEVIDTGSNGHFKVTTEGTERFRIDSGGRITVNDGSRLAGDANEGAQLRVTGTPLTRNQYYSPAGDYFGSFGYTDNTYTKSWIAVDSSYNKTSSVSSGIFLSAFHADAGGSACGHTIKNVRTDAGGLIFSSVATGSVNNPAVETERLRITSAGKMGIGTNNPQEQLVVSNSGAEGFEISAGIASNVNKIVNYNRSTSTYTSLRLDSAEYIFRIGASEKLRIGPSGQIGIGDPTNYGTSGQVLTSGGASGAVSWTTISGGGGASYGNSDVDNHLNTGGASSGQILSWNGSDYAWVADQGGSGGGGGISDVVDDTTPQLGGNLDLNSKNITGTGNITITGTLTSDGISVGNSSGSSDKITAGANDELQIYHDGTRSRIHDDATNATFFTTNALHIRDKADTEAIAKFTAGGAVELYHDNSKKLETTSSGITVSGTVTDSLGVPLRRLGTTGMSGNYTLVASDAGKQIRADGAHVLTVPNNVFETGDMITVTAHSSSNVTIQGSGVTIYNASDGSTGNLTLAARTICTIFYGEGGSSGTNQVYIAGGGIS